MSTLNPLFSSFDRTLWPRDDVASGAKQNAGASAGDSTGEYQPQIYAMVFGFSLDLKMNQPFLFPLFKIEYVET